MKIFHITIVQVGKTKASYLQEAEKEYIKRLGSDARVEVITVKDIKAPKNASPADIHRIKGKEGAQILKSIPPESFLVVLDEQGQQYTSMQFSEVLGKKRDEGAAHITFVIGGCYGLSEELRKRANLLLSFSKFTFTHEMVRSLLYEQLYRSFSLLKGKKYHY